ncbi:MAG: TlpA family protein disulfide reductase [Rikenellaceae bacterium]|nr:TlpA family protein disulfide reductase [Rikenellaceae bacterium]
MQRKLYISILFLTALIFSVNAQRIVIGEKAPDVKVAVWDRDIAPKSVSKAVLLDFFHSANDQCVKNMPVLNSLQEKYGDKLSVIIITRETGDKMAPIINGKNYRFFVGYDGEGKTFTSYGVRFVPFSVLINSGGRVAWTGNISSLTEDVINKALR